MSISNFVNECEVAQRNTIMGHYVWFFVQINDIKM